ncbi:MAG: bifunctional diguanylate cyclase/phosphodiesterase [Gammaproteobacteria bacterium]|nr:bifunctional diguanylate cyclase/phosphodiesterase [Gammaproteobacteria bacterium]
MQGFFNSILDVSGFTKKSKYVKKYLRESNIRMAVYMALVIVAIEIWMIVRSLIKNVIPGFDGTYPFMLFLFYNTSYYWLLLLTSISMMVYGITYSRKKKKVKTAFVVNVIFSLIPILYSSLVVLEIKYHLSSVVMRNYLVYALYSFCFLFGLFELIDAFYTLKHKEHSVLCSVGVITCFAMLCLTFGVRTSYSDFWSGKEILCYLTMIVYVACMLVFSPLISIGLVGTIFYAFYFLLTTMHDHRDFPEGDIINYITFAISITMISISIFNQRLRDARKDEELERMAKEDDLTRLLNFDHFVKLSKDELSSSKQGTKIFLFINIENFKSYNDKENFEKGNKFLIDFGACVKEVFNEDYVARQADDHYVVLTENSKKDFMPKLVLLQEKINTLDNDVFLEIKVGGFIPINMLEDPRRSVDKARYAAETIKNKYDKIYLEYDDVMDKGFHKMQYVINNIDSAIKNGWIKVYYQPVVWAETGELCGCEALARWIDPEYGFLSPGDFIPILEGCRQIHKLDKAIYDGVCRNIRYCLDNNIPIVPISLNFSRLDFELMDAVAEFEELVRKYNVPKHLLHVEITESAIADDSDYLKSCVNKLHEDDFAIWLDDFGSGYSSLNVLKDYPFDVIKLDMKFLSGFEHNERTRGIVDSVIQMAKKIKMQTLCEGVETKEEAEFLKEVGCGRLQGYLYGKAIPYDELMQKVKAGIFSVAEKVV